MVQLLTTRPVKIIMGLLLGGSFIWLIVLSVIAFGDLDKLEKRNIELQAELSDTQAELSDTQIELGARVQGVNEIYSTNDCEYQPNPPCGNPPNGLAGVPGS